MQSLDRAEIKALIQNVSGTHNDVRNRLMVLVTFYHGLRASEVTGKRLVPGGEIQGGIRGRDIQGGHLSVKRLKGSLPTVQPFVKHPDPLLDEATPLLVLANTIGPDELVFPITRFGFYKMMRIAGSRAGIPDFKKVRPHILKHSIACQTIKSAGIEMVRIRLGHKSIASTGHYLMASDAEAAEAIERAIL